MAKLTMAGYGKPGCGCPKTLTEGR
jgi:hypothetical protein